MVNNLFSRLPRSGVLTHTVRPFVFHLARVLLVFFHIHYGSEPHSKQATVNHPPIRYSSIEGILALITLLVTILPFTVFLWHKYHQQHYIPHPPHGFNSTVSFNYNVVSLIAINRYRDRPPPSTLRRGASLELILPLMFELLEW
jgi:hypothetical protein